MNTFNKLASENQGRFTFEPNELVEIQVNVSGSEIWVEEFRTANHFLKPIKKEYFSGLYGMMGYPSVEEKFNELLEKYSK